MIRILFYLASGYVGFLIASKLGLKLSEKCIMAYLGAVFFALYDLRNKHDEKSVRS